jgi:hypothetical protein
VILIIRCLNFKGVFLISLSLPPNNSNRVSATLGGVKKDVQFLNTYFSKQ